MYDNGNTGNANPFGDNSPSGFNSFPPPPPQRKNSKLWIIPVAIIGTIAAIAAIVFSVWTINLTQQNVQQRNGSSQEKLAPSGEEAYSDISSGDPELDDLNNAGSVAWSPDQFDYLFGDPPRSVYVSDVGSGSGSCALLLYEDYIVALGAERDAFNYFVARQGNAPIVVEQGAAGGTGDGLGFVLMADSEEIECFIQATEYLDN